MSDLLPEMKPMTALGGDSPRADTHGPVTLTEVTHLALASVQARLGAEEACRKRLSDLLESDAPGVSELVMHDPEASFWIGPDQWMIGAPHDSHEDLAVQLTTRFGETASITEQNDAWAVFDLRGEVAPVMELLCPINIRKMAVHTVQRTAIDHLSCFVTRRATDHLRILGPRSSAGSLHHALVTAMKSAH